MHLLAATTTVPRGIDVDREVLDGVLTAAESAVTHRRRYRGYVRPAGVLELLLIDPDNPRSLAFCARASCASTCPRWPAPPARPGPSGCSSDLEDSLEAPTSPRSAPTAAHRPNLEAFLAETHSPAAPARRGDRRTLHFATGPAPRPISSLALTEVMGVTS